MVIFDSYDLLVGENRKINPAYSRDWLHLNVKGYEYLNTNLEGFIERTMSEN